MRTRRGTQAATGAIALLATLAGAAGTAQAADVTVYTGRIFSDLPRYSYIKFHGAPGEANVVTMTREGRTFVFADSGAPLRSSDGTCEVSADGGTARCTVPEKLTGIDLELRDGDDRLTNDVAPGGPDETFEDPSFSYELDGGPGDDVLTGSELEDRIAGGAGNDRLTGRGGPDGLTDWARDDVHGVNEGGTDVMIGGEGDDSLGEGGGDDNVVDGGPGADDFSLGEGTTAAAGGDGDDVIFSGYGGTHTVKGEGGDDTIFRKGSHVDPARSVVAIDGGPGRDRVEYHFWEGSRYTPRPSPDDVAATIRLSATQTTTDNGLPGQSDSLTGVEDASGGVGRDTITGSEEANRLVGGTGADSIKGGAGADVLEGGAGGDAIDAVDGEVDTVACSDGPYRDAGDSLRSDTGDAVSRCSEAPPEPTKPTDPGKPGEPGEPGDTTGPNVSGTRVPRTIKLGRLRSRGLTIRLRSGDASQNRATAVLSTRRSRRLARRSRAFTGRATLTLRPRGKKVRRGSFRLMVRVSDAAGNATTLRRTIRVR